jgi:pimeloyl-ACP methyl ester carboxylesterase
VSAGWCFRHDPKIKGPSLQYFTEEQALQFLAAIRCPVLHITAVDGWPRPAEVVERRMRAVPDLENHTLPGSHHLHLDTDTAPAVIDVCAAFLRKRLGVLA